MRVLNSAHGIGEIIAEFEFSNGSQLDIFCELVAIWNFDTVADRTVKLTHRIAIVGKQNFENGDRRNVSCVRASFITKTKKPTVG